MGTLLDLDQLRTFILIAETGSFTKTADTVFRTQSAISMQIRRLEDRIGKPLFIRGGRQQQLTCHGERLLIYARRIIKLNDETIRFFQTDNLQAKVNIGLPDLYLEQMVCDALQSIFKNYPAIETSLHCEPSASLIEQIQRGTLDLAIVLQQAEQPAVAVMNVSPLVWVTSANGTAHKQDIVPLAVNRINCHFRKMLTDSLQHIQKNYRIALSASSIRSIIIAIQTGNVVSALPENFVTPDMRILNEKDGFPDLPNIALCLIRADNSDSPPIDIVADAIQLSFRQTAKTS